MKYIKTTAICMLCFIPGLVLEYNTFTFWVPLAYFMGGMLYSMYLEAVKDE